MKPARACIRVGGGGRRGDVRVRAAGAPASTAETPSPPARETAKAETVRLRRQKVEPLKIKMLTSDPDVVIYWLIED